MSRYAELVRIFTETLVAFGIAISVYIGFYLGFVISQVDRVGQATLIIKANNATNIVSDWLPQASQATNAFLPQTLLYAFLLVPLLVIPKLSLRHETGALTSLIFPIFLVSSWLALPAATLPASIPQAFVATCGASPDVNLAVNQIYTFITFYQSFVVALRSLTLITVTWVCARSLGVFRNILVNIPLIVIPIMILFSISSWLPIPEITISAGITCVQVTSVTGSFVVFGGLLPSYLGRLYSTFIELDLLIWIATVIIYLLSEPTKSQLRRSLLRFRSVLVSKFGSSPPDHGANL